MRRGNCPPTFAGNPAHRRGGTAPDHPASRSRPAGQEGGAPPVPVGRHTRDLPRAVASPAAGPRGRRLADRGRLVGPGTRPRLRHGTMGRPARTPRRGPGGGLARQERGAAARGGARGGRRLRGPGRQPQAGRRGRVGAAGQRRDESPGPLPCRPGHRGGDRGGGRVVDTRRDRGRTAATRPPGTAAGGRGVHRDRPRVWNVCDGLRPGATRRPSRPRRRRTDGVVLRAGMSKGLPGRPGRLPSQPLTTVADLVPSPEGMRSALESVGYLADEGIATALFCAARLPQPLLLEGEAGVGKTEAAKALADVLETPLIRLQCYEGIDAAEALYEWNFPRQLLAIKVSEAGGRTLSEDDLFGPEYLIARPLLRAVEHRGPRPAVLLIDEIDRADDEFEAFLFELLGEATVTIPELGTVRSSHPPIAVLTSNRTRDLHDALKRRCLYHWIDYPDVQRTTAIIRARVPAASQTLAAQVAAAVQRLRSLDVQKLPGVAEAINWVLALDLLGLRELDERAVEATIGSVLKYREDLELVIGRGAAWVATGS